MTCEDCKHSNFDNSLCHRYPSRVKIVLAHWCGEWKNANPTKRKTKAMKIDESEWTDSFKAYMEAHPRYFDPDGAWTVWVDLELEVNASHIIRQVKKYALTVQGKEAKYIKSNKNWLRDGGWKSHYDEVKSDSKACIDCAAPYSATHKYVFVDGKADKTKYRCEECRKNKNLSNSTAN